MFSLIGGLASHGRLSTRFQPALLSSEPFKQSIVLWLSVHRVGQELAR